MLMRFDPFRELDSLSQMWARQMSGSRQTSSMPMDAYRDGDRIVAHFDLPGVDPDSIDLTVEKNVLTVRAERTWEAKEGKDVLASERPQGTFTRQLFLGDTLDTEHVQASYDRGVLTIVIPVAEQAKPHRVEVKAGSEGGRAIPADSTVGSSSKSTTSAA
jgi:HSP20 family protein